MISFDWNQYWVGEIKSFMVHFHGQIMILELINKKYNDGYDELLLINIDRINRIYVSFISILSILIKVKRYEIET